MALHVSTVRMNHSLYCVVTIRFDSGEVIPVLVERSTWIPARLATRWVLLHRRQRSAAKTLVNNLFTLKLVYCWAKSRDIDLDELLLADGELSRESLKSLISDLQSFRSNRTKAQMLSAAKRESTPGSPEPDRKIAEAHIASPIDPDLAVIKGFLSWIADPVNVGFKCEQPRTISIERLNSRRTILRTMLDAYKVGTFPSRRPEPLSIEQLASLHLAIDAASTSVRVVSTASLFPRTPWKIETCLRNWLMFCLAEQHGFRIGEILKVTIEDIVSLTPGAAPTIHIRRRPDDPRDTRIHPPAVKTVERVFELSLQLRWGFRLYLTLRPPLGRFAGKSPYLFVSTASDPLSYSSAHSALQVLGKRVGISDLCWHRLRHTWAESVAKELFALNGIEEHGIEKLRYLGGWSENSLTPFAYIKNAIQESANQFLRRRNEQMYQGVRSIT